jgi:O-antigen/teichoic acid export membrane protein
VKKRFVRDLAIYAPSLLLPALTAFITTPILTRLLAPAEYGYWAQASSVAGFLTALAATALGSAALRFYPAYEAKANLSTFFATFAGLVTLVITLAAGVSVLLAFLLKDVLPSWLLSLLPLVLLIFVAQSVFNVCICVLRAQRRSGAFTVFQLLAGYGGLGTGLLLVAFGGFRVEGLLGGTLLALLAVLPFLLVVATRGVGIHPRRDFRLTAAFELWRYAWPLALGDVALWGLQVSDLFIIGSFWPARDVGLYSVSYNISAKSIDLLVKLFLLSLSPVVFRTWEMQGREATERALTMVTRVYLIVCLPAAIGMTILAFPFVALLTAQEYHAGSRIVGFVVFSSLAWGLINIANMGLTIKRQALRLGINTIIAATIHIGLQLIFVPRFGYVAAAVSTLLGYGVLLYLQAASSRPHLTWSFPFTTLRNVLVASIAMGLAAWGIYGLSGAATKASPSYLALSIAVAVPTYCACLWLLGEVDEAEKKTVGAMWARVSGR